MFQSIIKKSYKKKKEEVIYNLGIMKTKLIIIDEIQNVLQGPYNKMTQLITSLKTLNNTTAIPIILAGTQDAMSAISIDNQTKSRFKPLELPNWNNDEKFFKIYNYYRSHVTFKKSIKSLSKLWTTNIYSWTFKWMYCVIDILKDASIYAIRTKVKGLQKKR